LVLPDADAVWPPAPIWLHNTPAVRIPLWQRGETAPRKGQSHGAWKAGAC